MDFKKLLKSFTYGFAGIKNVLKTQQNMRVHVLVMLAVIFFGFLFKISKAEWLICLILFGLVIGAEMINSAIEGLCDALNTEYDERIKHIKDEAAGAVLVLAIVAAICGLIIFLPKFFGLG